MKNILTVLLTIVSVFTVKADTLLGNWNGKLEFGQMSLPIVFHITSDDGQKKCVMDSPDQGAENIPAVVDFLSEDSLAVSVPMIGAAYRGKLHDGILKGKFSQSGMSLDLNLKPGEFVRERKQTPQPPFPYPTEEVVFVNPVDSACLSGTLTYPMTFAMKRDVPVVLMVTGSGLQNRDEELFGHKPFAVIADYLAKMGIASLRYDDRGYGKSTGELKNATTHTFMTDAVAGINYLRNEKKFNRIGVLGHSEGGQIAFMCAADEANKLDFIISLAGPGMSGYDILMKQNEDLLKVVPSAAAYYDDYCKVLRKVFNHIMAEKKIDDAAAIIAEYSKQVGAELPEDAEKNLQKVLKVATPWMVEFLKYNPTKDISEVSCPVLAINGDMDVQVDAQTNIGAIKKSLKENDKNRLKIYPGLNHLFQHCTTGQVAEYAKIEETISPEVLNDIAQWILGLSK